MDAGEQAGEKAFERVRKRITEVYTRAQREVKKKLEEHTKKYKAEDAKKRSDLAEGRITQAQYDEWVKLKVWQGQQWQDKLDSITQTLANANQEALQIINGERVGVFAENATYQNFLADQHGIAGVWDIYDQATASRIIAENPRLLPPKKLIPGKDKAWNRRQLNNCIMQGILQGEGIEQIAARMARVTGSTNRAQMLRTARTSMTSAQNAGRIEAMHHQEDMGIKVRKMWIATLDKRTRDAHAELDGQIVDIDQPFHCSLGDIMFPGDPDAKPGNVYNCRCTLGYIYPDSPMANAMRRDQEADKHNRETGDDQKEVIEYRTYQEWKQRHETPQPENQPEEHIIAEGKDITQTWKRRKDQFAFEIQDVIDAQGFSGRPRIVNASEFNAAVRAANGGKGFIAQRTYTAPTREIADAYRQMLYRGEWYVDCSTGGAQYGQGMYCAADYTGVLSDGIREEMDHYASLGRSRLRGEAAEAARLAVWNEALSAADSEIEVAYIRDLMHEATPEQLRMLRHTTDEEDDRLLAKFSDYARRAMNAQYEAEAVAYTETITLDPSARIISFEEIYDLFHEYRHEYSYERMTAESEREVFAEMGLSGTELKDHHKLLDLFLHGHTQEQFARFDKLLEKYGYTSDDVYAMRVRIEDKYRELSASTISDVGSFAAALGYDAIDASGHGASGSYTVILNRTKVLILAPEGMSIDGNNEDELLTAEYDSTKSELESTKTKIENAQSEAELGSTDAILQKAEAVAEKLRAGNKTDLADNITSTIEEIRQLIDEKQEQFTLLEEISQMKERLASIKAEVEQAETEDEMPSDADDVLLEASGFASKLYGLSKFSFAYDEGYAIETEYYEIRGMIEEKKKRFELISNFEFMKSELISAKAAVESASTKDEIPDDIEELLIDADDLTIALDDAGGLDEQTLELAGLVGDIRSLIKNKPDKQSVAPNYATTEDWINACKANPSTTEMLNIETRNFGKYTTEQTSALRTYTGSAYSSMNGYLRDIAAGKRGHDSPRLGNLCRLCHEALDNSRLDRDMVLRRGTDLGDLAGLFMSGDFGQNMRSLSGKSASELNAMFAGKVGCYAGFTSTSSQWDRGFGGPVEILFNAPQGTAAASIMGISMFGVGEGETLLIDGTRVICEKIEEITEDNPSEQCYNGGIRVFLTILVDNNGGGA